MLTQKVGLFVPLLVISIFRLPDFCAAATFRVDIDGSKTFVSIQAALNAGATGDTIVVSRGTYIENIDFVGKDICLKSLDGPEVTIIDGSTVNEAVVRFRRGESNAAVLEGFTLENGRGSVVQPGFTSHMGGGVFIQNAEPTIRSNRIIGNGTLQGGSAATVWGGGIYCETRNSSAVISPQIIGNVIQNNKATINGGGLGFVNGRILPVIRDNSILNNVANEGDGGGVWIITLQNGGVIDNNRIEHNYAGDHGGGIYAVGALFRVPINIEISHNRVLRNTAAAGHNSEDSGGGLWIQNTNASVISNTIVGNEGLGPDSTWGGGDCPVKNGLTHAQKQRDRP